MNKQGFVSLVVILALIFGTGFYYQQKTVITGNSSGITGIPITVCDTPLVINTTANVKLADGVTGKKWRVCSYQLVVTGAESVTIVEGTGALCATGTAGMNGGATAALGQPFAANGGIAHGGGLGMIMKQATSADNLCLFKSGVGQVSGVIMATLTPDNTP